MSDRNRQPILLALGDTTVRIDPRTTSTSYLPMQIIESPHYDQQGNWVRDGRVIQLYLAMDDAKLLADAIYAQDVLGLVE